MIDSIMADNRALTVYSADTRYREGLLGSWIIMLKNIYASRELIWQLFRRDFLATYKTSHLGLAWLFLAPLMGIVSWVFLQASGILNPGKIDIPYPVYVLIGTSMWGAFMGFFGAASETLRSGSGLLTQVNFPHEILLIKQNLQFFASFLISLVLNFFVLVCYGFMPHWQAIFFPLAILPLFFLGSGLGLLTGMIAIVAVDIRNVISMGLGLMMYVTPVLYVANNTHHLLQLAFKWNPLTYVVCTARDLILYGRIYGSPLAYSGACVACLMIFLFSWRAFYVSEGRLIEKML